MSSPQESIFLDSGRLILRPFRADDDQRRFELDSDPAVMRFINGGRPTPLADIKNIFLPRLLAYHRQSPQYGFWAAIEKENNAFIGWFHFKPAADHPGEIELGYRLMRRAWGKGYATEGSRALLENGFRNGGVQVVTARAMPGNIASIRVMQKMGMRYERRYVDGNGVPQVKYRLTRKAFFAVR